MYLNEIASICESERIGKVLAALIDSIESAKQIVIGAQHHLISAGHIDTDSVIGKALGRVEIEHKHQSGSFKGNQLVALVLVADVRL